MRRCVILILLGLALVAGGGSGGWVLFAQWFEKGISAWVQARRAEGYGVEFTSLTVSGYPLGWTAEIGHPVLTSRSGHLPWRWIGADLRVNLQIFQPQRVRITFPGRHLLELSPTTIKVSVATAQADISFNERGSVDRIDTWLGDIKLTLDGLTQELSVKNGILKARRVIPEATAYPAVTATVDTRWDGVVLPDELTVPLGTEVAVLAFKANLRGEVPSGPTDLVLTTWRDTGGTVEIPLLKLEWGPLILDAQGTLTLDEDLQPIGAVTARVRGLIETIAAFEIEGVLEQRAAVAARLVASAVSRPTGPSGTMEAELQVTLRDQTVMLGPVPLTKIPRLRWSGPWYQAP